MSFKPTIPLVPSPGVRALLAEGFRGEPLVRWPKGPDHRPSLRLLLRAAATDAAGAAHPFLHVASVTLTGPPDLTAVATARVYNREEAPREWVYLDDGDGGLFAAPPSTEGPGHARDMALRELDHLAARLLGPDAPADAKARDEPYHPAISAGCPVVTLSALGAEDLPTLDALKASGVEVRSTDASEISARAALAVGRAFAWTGDAVALPARLPHWNLACDESGRVRLACRVGDPRDLAAWSAAAGFALSDGERALAAAKAVAAASGSRTVNVVGEAEVLDHAPEAYDGARETAAAMGKPLKALLRKVLSLLDEPAREAAEALLAHPGTVADARESTLWWRAWAAFAATLPDEEPEGIRDLRRLHLVRVVLEASGHAAGKGAPIPETVRPEPEPAPDQRLPERGPDDMAALATSARLVLAGLEFSVLAQNEAVQDHGRLAEILRDASGIGADLMPYLTLAGEAYRVAWEEVLQAGIRLRAKRDAPSLDRLSRALSGLWDVDPETFPDIPSAARWAMDLRPRQRVVTRASAAFAAEDAVAVVEAPPVPAPVPPPAVTVRRAAPPPRAPGRGRGTRPPVEAPAVRPAPIPEPEGIDHGAVAAAEAGHVTEPAAPAVPEPPLPEREPGLPEPIEATSERTLEDIVREPVAATPPPTPAELGPEPKTGPSVPAGRPEPTRNGLVVIAAMRGKPPMRKTDIAALAEIGRGAANRTVDRLVLDGWMMPDGANLFRLVSP